MTDFGPISYDLCYHLIICMTCLSPWLCAFFRMKATLVKETLHKSA